MKLTCFADFLNTQQESEKRDRGLQPSGVVLCTVCFVVIINACHPHNGLMATGSPSLEMGDKERLETRWTTAPV